MLYIYNHVYVQLYKYGMRFYFLILQIIINTYKEYEKKKPKETNETY